MQGDSKLAKSSLRSWVTVLLFGVIGCVLSGLGISVLLAYSEPIPGYIGWLAGVVMATGGLLLVAMGLFTRFVIDEVCAKGDK